MNVCVYLYLYIKIYVYADYYDAPHLNAGGGWVFVAFFVLLLLINLRV